MSDINYGTFLSMERNGRLLDSAESTINSAIAARIAEMLQGELFTECVYTVISTIKKGSG